MTKHTKIVTFHFVSSSRSSGTEDSPIRVGFVTYDRVIQFYNVKGSMAQPQMMVMTDVDDVFVPMVDGFIVSLAEAKIVLERYGRRTVVCLGLPGYRFVVLCTNL